jgi:hypothetical protein
LNAVFCEENETKLADIDSGFDTGSIKQVKKKTVSWSAHLRTTPIRINI